MAHLFHRLAEFTDSIVNKYHQNNLYNGSWKSRSSNVYKIALRGKLQTLIQCLHKLIISRLQRNSGTGKSLNSKTLQLGIFVLSCQLGEMHVVIIFISGAVILIGKQNLTVHVNRLKFQPMSMFLRMSMKENNPRRRQFKGDNQQFS